MMVRPLAAEHDLGSYTTTTSSKSPTSLIGNYLSKRAYSKFRGYFEDEARTVCVGTTNVGPSANDYGKR